MVRKQTKPAVGTVYGPVRGLTYSPEVPPAAVPMVGCPIAASMGLVSKKWTMALVRDMSYFRLSRYHEFLKNNPGLTDRMLGLRLKQMQHDGLISRRQEGEEVHYQLTARGRDLLPIMAGLMSFGVRQLPEQVFEDKTSRTLNATYPFIDINAIANIFHMDTGLRANPAGEVQSVAERGDQGA